MGRQLRDPAPLDRCHAPDAQVRRRRSDGTWCHLQRLGLSRADARPDGARELYRTIYQWKDPIHYGGMAKGEVRQLDELIDRDLFTTSDYYRGLCAPFEIENAFFGYLGRQGAHHVWLNGSRGRVEGAFKDHEVATVLDLLPHLFKAVAIHRRMDDLQAQATAYSQSLAAIGVGLITLDPNGHISSLSPSTRRLLNATSAVRCKAPTAALRPWSEPVRAGLGARQKGPLWPCAKPGRR